MAVFQFSALSDGQAISFNATADVLNFDQTAIAAADIRVTIVGTNVQVSHVSSGKDVTLLNVNPFQLAATNVTFADGSRLLFGDNSTAQNDNAADSLTGTAGRDLLVGFGGADTMSGGLGNDTYIVGAGDVLSDTGGTDTVESDVDWQLADGFENLTATGTANVQLTGNNGTNILIGNSGNNFFNPRGGNDTIIGGAGNDFVRLGGGGAPTYGSKPIDLGAGFDGLDFGGLAKSALVVDLAAGTLAGGGEGGAGNATLAGIEQVIGDGFNDRLSGSAAAESLNGGGGNDTLDGRGGNDTLTGGLGQDTFAFTSAPGSGNVDAVTDLTPGTDKLSFDNFTFGTIGPAGNFAAGDPRFAAGAGFTSGRDASDRLVYNTTTGQLFYDADGNGTGASQLVATLQGAPALAATDIVVTGQAQPNPGQPTAGNDSLTGTDGNDSINGLAGNDTINALGGNDTIDGGPGADSMVGGLGDDLYFVDDPGDVTIEQAGGLNGIDTVNASVSHTLGAFVNNLMLVGSTAIDGTGNEIDNVLIGNDADNVLSGRAGKDTLTGGKSQDQFVFDQTPGAANADRITDFDVTLDSIHLDARVMPALGASGNFLSGDMRFYAAVGATGGHDADDRVVFDTSTGNLYYDADGNGAGAGQLVVTLQPGAALRDFSIVVDNGTAGAFIQGTSGNDNLLGTLGHDTIDGLGGNDTIDGSEGDDRIDGGTGNDSLTAAEGFDLIVGGDGNDTLNGTVIQFLSAGETAVDTMDGGLGDDVYFVDSPSDVLSDAGGIDTVQVFDIDWTLGAGFENLVIRNDFSESSFTGIGNDLDNVMSVTFTSVRLEGRGGNDTLLGSGSLHGDALLGGDGNDSLVASSGDDGLDGGAGNDTLRGGGDLDTLTGGTGADSFIFDVRPGESALDADVVTDFTSGVDRIRLDARVMPELGASGTLTADDPRFFAAPGAAAGHDADDRLVYDTSSGQLYFDPDGSGAETAGLIATLAGPLAATDITIDNGTAPGAQFIQGTSGNDSLTGTSGNDTLDGGAGVDTMNGGLGDDTYVVTAGDVLTDAGGVDTVLSPVAWTLADGFENLTATGTAEVNLTGNNAANVLTGNAVHNFFNPRGGNDTILGAGGDDWVRLGGGGVPSYGTKVIDGGAGFDTLDFGGFAKSAIVVDLASNGLSGGGEAGAGSATLLSTEQVIGDGFNDWLSGSFAAEALNGGAGNDTINGRTGNDTLTGGAGQDTFLFYWNANLGQITDFVSATDKLSFDNLVFAGLGAPGSLAPGDARFFSGAGASSAQDAADRLIYNTTTGQLFYDADGNGFSTPQLIATLQGAPALAATDITIFPGFVEGTAGNDSLVGTQGDDRLSGLDGNDTIDGLGGNDGLIGGSGANTLDGGGGADYVEGGDGADLLLGGDGNDELAGMSGDDTLLGGAGNDWLHGDGGINVLDGGAGNDFLEQGSALDSMEGGLGNDTFRIFSAVAITDAGGIDTIQVHASTNWTLAPGLENLRYFITMGDDHGVHGGLAVGNEIDNVIDVSTADGSSLDGRAGNDTLIGSGHPDTYYFTVSPGVANADLIAGFSGFRSGSDTIALDDAAHPDLGAGGRFVAGDARFFAGAGATSGHDASDRVVYDTSTGEVFYDADGSGAGAAQLIATLQGAPVLAATDIAVVAHGGSNEIFGFPFNDRIFGTNGSDLLDAGGGDDDISGEGGNDTLIGASGIDTLTGGTGSDSFVFAAPPGLVNVDLVTDFVSGTDKATFDNSVFTALGADGDFVAGDARFAAGAGFGFTAGRDASDRILYDTTTGSLYYDADGSGAGAARLVAALQGSPALTATDITVI